MALMPQGLVRIQQSRQSHFVTFSCYRREAWLADEGICRAFLDSLECVRSTRGLRADGYVRMPEHVHLLLSEPERGLLCGALQALKISLVRRPAGGRTLCSAAITIAMLSHHAEFVEQRCAHIHRNPLVRGLCAQPEEWPLEQLPSLPDRPAGRGRDRVRVEPPCGAPDDEPNPMKLAARVQLPHLPNAGRYGAPSTWRHFRCGPPAFLHSILNIRSPFWFSLQTSTYIQWSCNAIGAGIACDKSQRWRRCSS